MSIKVHLCTVPAYEQNVFGITLHKSAIPKQQLRIIRMPVSDGLQKKYGK